MDIWTEISTKKTHTHTWNRFQNCTNYDSKWYSQHVFSREHDFNRMRKSSLKPTIERASKWCKITTMLGNKCSFAAIKHSFFFKSRTLHAVFVCQIWVVRYYSLELFYNIQTEETKYCWTAVASHSWRWFLPKTNGIVSRPALGPKRFGSGWNTHWLWSLTCAIIAAPVFFCCCCGWYVVCPGMSVCCSAGQWFMILLCNYSGRRTRISDVHDDWFSIKSAPAKVLGAPCVRYCN